MAREISRRSLLGAPIALALLRPGRAEGQAPGAPRLPILPLNTHFICWDHHWIQWLPDHPVYEAIEATVARTDAGDPIIRLWLTERAFGKRQVHYLNRAESIAISGPETHFVPIALNVTGAPGAAQDLDLGFTDKHGEAVRWRMHFPAGTPLSEIEAGLKPQDRQAVRAILFFWFINPGAVTADARLTIGGRDYAVHADRPAGQLQHAAYASGSCSAAIAYGASTVVPTRGGFTSSFAGGRAFAHSAYAMPGRGIYACDLTAFGRRSRIVLGYDGDSVVSYRHSQGDHDFSIRFDPPLPAYAAGGEIGFRMAVDDHPVASGIVRPAGTAAMIMELHWDFADPPWAQAAGLVTAITPHEDGGYAMRVSARP